MSRPSAFDNICRVCKKKKLSSEFKKSNRAKRGYTIICKECWNKDVRKKYKYKPRYGKFSQEDYLILFEQQNGVCAICGRPETTTTKFGAIRPLSIDHCHKTGKIRKLLCMRCNVGLGCFNDDENLFLKALQYLKENQDE